MTRRELAWAIGLANWLRAAPPQDHRSHSHAPLEPDRWTSFRPKFFSAEEFKMLDAFSAILIPTDGTPGAREAHVAHFIDFAIDAAAEHAPEMQTEWRRAMEWLRAHDFGSLSAEQQLALITSMSEPETDRTKKHDGFPVYRLIKDMTVRAYYTSRAGLVDALEYKGNAFLTEFPACTHPEHRKV
jgi:hypothetical protein